MCHVQCSDEFFIKRLISKKKKKRKEKKEKKERKKGLIYVYVLMNSFIFVFMIHEAARYA